MIRYGTWFDRTLRPQEDLRASKITSAPQLTCTASYADETYSVVAAQPRSRELPRWASVVKTEMAVKLRSGRASLSDWPVVTLMSKF